jgi:hypothetical protein
VLDDRRQHLAPIADMPVQRRRVRPQAIGKSPRREPGQSHVVQQLNPSRHHVARCQRATGAPRSRVPSSGTHVPNLPVSVRGPPYPTADLGRPVPSRTPDPRPEEGRSHL